MNTLTNLKYTLAVTAGLCSSFAYAQNHPHIILIMTDQQRADAIGCMGNDAVISPNLDALAAEGTLFMNGYSSCPSSTPARAKRRWLLYFWNRENALASPTGKTWFRRHSAR